MKERKKILVTGGCGFIGSHTVLSLVSNGYEPVIVDSLENSEAFIHESLEELTGSSIRFYHANCCDEKAMEELFTAECFDGVIHFAAYKAVGESVENPLKYYTNNIGSLLVILELCQKHQIANFIFSSSCTVYGNPYTMPVTEETPVAVAESPYGSTKIMCERIVNDFTKAEKWFKPVLLRYFNPIGNHPEGLIGELPIGVPNNLIPYLTQTAAGIREQLTVYGGDYNTPDGTCIRDYIHVLDIAEAHVLSLRKEKDKGPFPKIYNLGTGKGYTVKQVIETFEKVNNIKVNYRIGDRRKGDVEAIYASNEKAKAELGWECKYTLADAMKHVWLWQNRYPQLKDR